MLTWCVGQVHPDWRLPRHFEKTGESTLWLIRFAAAASLDEIETDMIPQMLRCSYIFPVVFISVKVDRKLFF